MKKTLIQKIVVLKLSAFCFEISSFSCPGCAPFHIASTAASTWCGMAQFYFTGLLPSFFNVIFF